ncbi:MAG: hypothetical protein AABW68_02795 [archaeon]
MTSRWKTLFHSWKKGFDSLWNGEKESYLSRTEANRMLGNYLHATEKGKRNPKP